MGGTALFFQASVTRMTLLLHVMFKKQEKEGENKKRHKSILLHMKNALGKRSSFQVKIGKKPSTHQTGQLSYASHYKMPTHEA